MYTCSSVVDITERKKQEEELQKMDRLESIGTLAGGIAHDFNNLLTGILGNVTLLNGYMDEKGPASNVAQEIAKACLQAQTLTQQLLTFARGGTPVKKIASVGRMLKEGATFALSGSEVKGRFSMPNDLWLAEVDEGQVNQVISNLVINRC